MRRVGSPGLRKENNQQAFSSPSAMQGRKRGRRLLTCFVKNEKGGSQMTELQQKARIDNLRAAEAENKQ
jgi:hypothetical protein